MEFSKEYFLEEVRDGFFVSSIMKRYWAAQIEVLEEIKKVCQQNNIKWFADCGTLLGAVRHRGFIPWDDDIDICMERVDYEKFLKIAKQQLPQGYLVRNMYTEDDYFDFTTRIVNGRVFSFESDFLEKYHQFPYIAGIDIFVLDNIYEDIDREKWRIDICEKIDNMIYEYSGNGIKKNQFRKQFEKLAWICNYQYTGKPDFPIELYRLEDFVYKFCNDSNSKEIAIMNYWTENRSHKFYRKFYSETVTLPFEETVIKVPVGYQEVLKTLYGDYAKVSKLGGLHDYPLFKTQEDLLIKKLGNRLIGRDITKLSLDFSRNYSRMDLKLMIQTELEQMLNNIKAICDRKLIRQQVLIDFAMIQNEAIEIGKGIEQLNGEGTKSVHQLEVLCEQIYLLYQKLSGEMGDCQKEINWDKTVKLNLEEIVNELDYTFKSEIMECKEILIIPYINTDWDRVLSVCQKEIGNNEKYNITVLLVPLFVRNALGESIEEYPMVSYIPENFKVVTSDNYNIQNRHPDMIIFQNPFDDTSYYTKVNQEYYSDQLRNSTDALIYVSTFDTDDIVPGEEKSLQTLDYYIKVPAIINADKVYINSKKNENVFIQELTKIFGENSKNYWQKKIVSFQNNCNKATQKNKKGSSKELGKKNILYYVSVSSLFIYEETAIKKIEKCIEIFRASEHDINILWVQDDNLDVMRNVSPNIYKNYMELVDEFCESNLGEIISFESGVSCLNHCDGYYGDVNSFIQTLVRDNVPVMIQDVMM